MGARSAPLADWPWDNLGNYKYVVLLPVLCRVVLSSLDNDQGQQHSNWWCSHVVLLCVFRYLQQQAWNTFSRLHCLNKKYQIKKFATSYEQVDREFHSDNNILFHGLLLSAACIFLPEQHTRSLPLFNARGLLLLALLHAFVTEPLYYVMHRLLHSHILFCNYHSLHHASITPEPATAGTRTLAEELMQTALLSLPIVATTLAGEGSVALVYIYILVFDGCKQMGHCNVEFVPVGLFRAFPLLRYLIYTPSYHSLHHTELDTNFCLFMPLFDHLGGTRSSRTEQFHAELRRGRDEEVPSFVFLAHCIDILSSLHVSFVFRTVASMPYTTSCAFIWVYWPFGLIAFFLLWAWGRTFVAYEYMLRGLHAQTWVVPRYGVHYFLPFGLNSINNMIEKAILDADRMGVKVLSLAALNKNESLNGGGMLFVRRHQNLRVRVVHGNTLTAAVVLNELPEEVGEVFLTGATSKIGRAIALYLCRRHVRVLMLTSSRERYESIVSEAAPQHRRFLVQVTKYQAGQNCKRWIIGKWVTEREQAFAPVGTHFHQFVVPPVHEWRTDCTYGKFVAMRLPQDVVGMHTCEYINERGVVAACHAGGLLHALEGWAHHEVGSIDVDRIDVVWQAALQRGFAQV